MRSAPALVMLPLNDSPRKKRKFDDLFQAARHQAAFHRGIGHRNQPGEWFRRSVKYIVTQNTVTHKEIEVGRVFLAMSQECINNLVLTASGLAILLLCVVNVAVFATNYLLSRWYLFKPLSSLEASVRTIAAGNLDAPLDNGVDPRNPLSIGRYFSSC